MSVTQARKELVSQGVRYAEARDDTVKNRSLRALSYERISTLDNESDAQAIADEVLSDRKIRRNIIRISTRGQRFKRNIGDTVTLNISDFSPTSVDGIIMNIDENFDQDQTILEVWT